MCIDNDFSKSKIFLSQQLSNAVTMAAKQDQITWTIFGVFWAANAVLLVALFPDGNLPEANVGITVSIVGVFLSLVWFFIQVRSIAWMKYYDLIIQRLEGKDNLNISSDIILAPIQEIVKKDTKIKKIFECSIRVRWLLKGSALFVSIMWILSALYFFFLH